MPNTKRKSKSSRSGKRARVSGRIRTDHLRANGSASSTSGRNKGQDSGFERDLEEWSEEATDSLSAGINETAQDVTQFARASAETMAYGVEMMLLPFTMAAAVARSCVPQNQRYQGGSSYNGQSVRSRSSSNQRGRSSRRP
jgi:hypothetical protein